MPPHADIRIEIRPELAPLPVAMKDLPLDERGYPVPWFVDWIDGKPEFRAMDGRKYVRALKERLCWVCGGKLGTYLAFVAGPTCGINRTSSEPPSHLACAEWSAVNCPFLSNPRMVRREDEISNNQQMRDAAPGIALTRNPGVALVWITRSYEVFNDGKNKPLILMGEPERVEWFAEGRPATRAEVDASIESGLPMLEAAAATEKGAIEALNRAIKRFVKYIPAA